MLHTLMPTQPADRAVQLPSSAMVLGFAGLLWYATRHEALNQGIAQKPATGG